MATYATPNEAYVGMPATFAIGTDRYATQVVAIEYFKSGNRAGQVKAIHTPNYVFTLRTVGKRAGRLILEGGTNGTLLLGVAEDYRDPHF